MKKSEQLLRELSEIREDYILEADPEKKAAPKSRWGVWAAAAGIVLAVGVTGWVLLRPKDPDVPVQAEAPNPDSIEAELPAPGSEGPAPEDWPGETSEWEIASYGNIGEEPVPTDAEIDPALLPKITLSDGFSGSYGFEGYLAYSIDELENGNPCPADGVPVRLPVYVNHSYDPAGYPTGLDEAALTIRLDELLAAGIIGPVGELRPLDDFGDERFAGLQAEGEGFGLRLLADGTVEIYYPEGLSLPEEYVFRYDSTEEEARACLSYFLENWAKRLGMPHPRMALFGDRDIYGGRLFRYGFFDESTHIERAIENFAFRQVQFFPNEEGKLWIVRIFDGLAAAEKLGDYPIIRPKTAEELLRAGHYLTNVPYALTGEEQIAKVELVYRAGRTEQTLLPYYRFYVDITGVEGFSPEYTPGLKNFGAYYVPAVESAYLENMP